MKYYQLESCEIEIITWTTAEEIKNPWVHVLQTYIQLK